MTTYISLLGFWLAVLALSVGASDVVKGDSVTVASLSIFPKKWDKDGNAIKIEQMARQVNVVFAHPNHSLIINSDGEIISEGQKDTFVMQTIPLRNKAKRRASVIHRRPTMYNGLTAPAGKE